MGVTVIDKDMSRRIKTYWGIQSDSFKKTRINELADNEIGRRWLDTFHTYFPAPKEKLKILDVGTGAGYFSILLANHGHITTCVDLTPEMILAAKELAVSYHTTVDFQVMDAMDLSFSNNTFDVIVTRNLTWTLPDIPKAYHEWFRVLRQGGVLMNFDANYGNNVLYEQEHAPTVSQDTPYGHPSLSEQIRKENAEITLSMEASRQVRPEWDLKLLKECGFSESGTDLHIGKRILQEWDQVHSPMFLIWAVK